METVLEVTVLTLTLAALCGGMGTADLPHPWLTLDRTAKVLHLRCRAPEKYNLDKVYGLGVSAFLNQYSVSHNISLVDMTSNMRDLKPKVNKVFTVSRAWVNGEMETSSVSLEFVFPVTSKELGHYFCTVKYFDVDDNDLKFTTGVSVDTDFVSSHVGTVPKTINNFEARVIDAHEVSVTWKKPATAKFKEASVSRIMVDSEGSGIAPSFTLFATNGSRDFVYDSTVLLSKLNAQDSGNMSMRLYVERDPHSSSFRYSCYVPYPACTGHSSLFCSCCRSDTHPDTEACPAKPEADSLKYLVPLIVVSVLLGLSFMICVVFSTVFLLYKFRKCDSPCLVKLFSQKRTTTSENENGGRSDGTGPTTPGRPRNGDGGKEETSPDGRAGDTKQAREHAQDAPPQSTGIVGATPAPDGTQENRSGAKATTSHSPSGAEHNRHEVAQLPDPKTVRLPPKAPTNQSSGEANAGDGAAMGSVGVAVRDDEDGDELSATDAERRGLLENGQRGSSGDLRTRTRIASSDHSADNLVKETVM